MTAPDAHADTALAVRESGTTAPAFVLPDWTGLDTPARLAALDIAAAAYGAAHPAQHHPRIRRRLEGLAGVHRVPRHPRTHRHCRRDGRVRRLARPGQARRGLHHGPPCRRGHGHSADRGVDVDERAGEQARNAIKAAARRLSQTNEKRGRGQAPPSPSPNCAASARRCPTPSRGSRDRALLLVGFPVAARRRETASLRVGDIVHQVLDDEDGPQQRLLVHIRWVKTGTRTAPAPYGTHPLTRPVRAWHAWTAAAGIADDLDGPAFRPIDRHGNLDPTRGLSPEAVGEILKRIAKNAGVEKITGHSVRAGLATAARRAGHDAKSIADQGGWSPTSTALYGYMRRVDEWADNAAIGLGL
ncbi:tyrosine-type recombinase/integrase [Yinghuangia aomiensis]